MFNNLPRPSKASASTRCQRCLLYGHYSYECKELVTERPYISRPSRTQQLINPKLVPILQDEDVPEEFKSKKGVADQILGAKDKERQEMKDKRRGERRRSERRRRRERSPSAISSHSESDRSPVARSRSRSPTRSQSPKRSTKHKRHRKPRDQSLDREHSIEKTSEAGKLLAGRRAITPDTLDHTAYNAPRESKTKTEHQRPRERSLSPYSRRLALTRGIGSPQGQ